MSAYLHYRRNHREAARDAFERIVHEHATTAYAAWSAELLLALLAAR